jgi:DMSO/TMAO reductase YedYZ heme-binding membrane subunit
MNKTKEYEFRKKSPSLAGWLGFLCGGGGYLYLGRKALGFWMIVLVIVLAFAGFWGAIIACIILAITSNGAAKKYNKDLRRELGLKECEVE